MDKKPFYLSKTLWMQVFAVVALLVPASAGFIGEHLGAAGTGWAIINVVLRVITKKELA